MCGIIGYNGKNDATVIIGKGLKNLEYRGYDSYGSGFVTNNKLFVHKSIGFVPDHYDQFLAKVKSHCGIGHVRWATNGKNTVKNSHPHYGGNKELILVHNGIITNYKYLKSILIKEGYKFKSDTDTEVLAHWIHYKKEVSQVEGDFACLFMCKGSEIIYAIRRNTPLFLAQINCDNIISSSLNVFDAMAINYEFFELENDRIYKIDKNKMNAVWQKVRNSPSIKAKSSSKTITLEEIKEQANIFQNYHPIKLHKNKKLVMFGCGSSYNAALISKYFFAQHGFQHVEVCLPAEIGKLDENTQYIAISQSGETKDVLDVARKLHNFYAVTNKSNNTLEQLATKTIYLNCGTEIGVAATKSFTSTLNVLCQMAGEKINEEELAKTICSIFHNPLKISKKFRDFNNMFLFGSGIIHYANCEGALKLKEMANVHAEAIHVSEMKHGPITLLNKNVLSIFVGNEESIPQVEARGGEVLLLTDENVERDNSIIMPKTSNDLEKLIVVSIYLQLIALELGKMRGVNVDRPANLAKCITI